MGFRGGLSVISVAWWLISLNAEEENLNKLTDTFSTQRTQLVLKYKHN